MRVRRSVVVVILVAVLGAASPAHGAPGDPAPGFGVDGMISTRLGNGVADDVPVGAVRQNDGKIVLVSTQTGLGTISTIDMVRLLPDGRVDTEFGFDGRRSIVLQPKVDVFSVAAQGNKILVGGRASTSESGNTDILVMRFLRNGLPDPSFSGDGRVTIEHAGGHREAARSVAAGPDGTVVVGGQTDNDAFVMRLTDRGVLDTAFGDRGVRVHVTTRSAFPCAVHVARDGSTTFVYGDRLTITRVVRYTPGGQLDTAFGGGIISLGPEPARILGLRVDRRNGRTVVAVSTASTRRVLVRTDSGEPDTGFGGGDGVVEVPSSDTLTLTDLTLDASGSIALAGVARRNGDASWWASRLLPTGEPDEEFSGDGLLDRRLDGSDGARVLIRRPEGYVLIGTRGAELTALFVDGDGAVTDIRSVDASRNLSGLSVHGVDVATDGRVLVTGGVTTGRNGRTSRFVLMRHRSDGWPDSSFGGDGIVTPDLPGRRDTFVGARQLPSGSVVAWGVSDGRNGREVVVMRFTATGALDGSFGNRGVHRVEVGGRSVVVGELDAVGRVVLAHSDQRQGSKGLVVRRLSADGTTDLSFGTQGRTLVADRGSLPPSDIGIVSGRVHVLLVADKRLVRFTESGALDRTFGNRGRLTLRLDGVPASGVITSDGGVVALEGALMTGVQRLAPNGTKDLSFAGDGSMSFVGVGPRFSRYSDVALDGAGRIVLSGIGVDGFGALDRLGSRVVIARITASGVLDATFGGDGFVETDAAVGDVERNIGLAVAADGDPVVLVESESPWSTARLLRVEG